MNATLDYRSWSQTVVRVPIVVNGRGIVVIRE